MWLTTLTDTEHDLDFACGSGVHRKPRPFAGFFLQDPKTVKLIRDRDPIILDTLNYMVEHIEGLYAVYAVSDILTDYMIEHLLADREDLDKTLETCQIALASPFCNESDRASIERFFEIVRDPYAWKQQQREKRNASKPKPKKGFVYLLQSGPYYKIGISRQVDKRLAQLSAQPPFDIELLHTIRTKDMYALESELHTHFTEKRKNGEWFELSLEDVEYIKGLQQ